MVSRKSSQASFQNLVRRNATLDERRADDQLSTITIVRESQPSPMHPIEVLLRRRLLVLCFVFAVLTGLATVVFFWGSVLPVLRRGSGVRPAVWGGLAFYILLVLYAAACARILWSPRSLSLRALRTMEVAGFSALAAGEVWRIYATWRAGDIFRYVTTDVVGVTLLGSRQSLTWFALIVAYGIFIPNTWRRCALVVGMLASTPIVATTICNAAFGRLDVRLFSVYLLNLAIWMLYAGALAIYGSHRIDVLRREALEARKLGQYQLKELVGAGGMGEVYLAEHLLLRRPCAIKLIRMDRAGDAESLLRFEREVQATAALTHANTVQVYDYGHTNDGTFYYVMEYLPGLTVDQLVQRHGPVAPSRAIHLLRQICGALGEAHQRGLIHRDIKPSNIIVCERGGLHDVAKLLDFGIVQSSRTIDDRRRTLADGPIAGTPTFMSPEQASGAGMVDARSDIYSVGCVAYFLLTGAPPFVRATTTELLSAHIHEAVIPPQRLRSDMPADIEAIVLRCLRKNPDERYQDTKSLNDALAECGDART
jgi:eukaryotic-like serine/threonine-protein kinase